jgi:hypothetical protein
MAVYSVNAALTGNWEWGQFGKSAAFGALGGALGGGLGALGTGLGSFGQSLGYNVLSNVAGNVGANAAFGNPITAGLLVGSTIGGLIGGGIGGYNGVSGSSLKNIGAELSFSISKGAFTGAIGGTIGAIIDGGDIGQGFLNGAKYGAIAHGTLAGINILTMGPAYVPDKSYGDFPAGYKPVYRKGTYLSRAIFGEGTGVALGRNLVTHTLDENQIWEIGGRRINPILYNEYLRAHETAHYMQQIKMGFDNFYARTLREYIKYGAISTYKIRGTLENNAELYSLFRVGFYYDTSLKKYNLIDLLRF